MNVTQGQIIQTGTAHLGGGDGVVRGIGLGRIAVNQGDGVRLAAVCPESLQKGGAVHILETGTPDPCLEFLHNPGFHTAGEDGDVTGPGFLQPGAAGAAGVVIAGGDEYGNGTPCQGGFYGIDGFPAGFGAVEKVTSQKYQIAAFSYAEVCDFAGDGQLLPAQKLPLFLGKSSEGGVQVPVGAV